MLKIKNILSFLSHNFSAILFILIPYSLIFSIFLTETIFLILTFLSLKKNHFKLKKLFLENNIIKMILIFYFIVLFSSIYNQSKFEIILKNLAYIRFIFYAISISFVLDEFKYLKKYFLYSLLSCYLLLFFGSVYEFIFKKYCIFFDESSIANFTNELRFCSNKYFIGNLIRPDRISSFFGDEMVLGSYTARILPLVCFLIFNQFENSGKKMLIFYFIVFISTLIVLLSGERVSLFYLIIFLAITLLYINIKYKNLLYLILILSSFCIVYFSPILKDRIYKQTYSQIFKEEGDIKFFSKEHQSHAISALKIFKDNVLIGIGPKNFRYECRKEKYNTSVFSCTSHPHNFYIQLLSETGLIGLLIPLFFLVYIMNFFIKNLYIKILNKKNNTELKDIFIFTSFLITLFPIIPTGNIFNNWLSIIFYLPLGFFIHSKKKDD